MCSKPWRRSTLPLYMATLMAMAPLHIRRTQMHTREHDRVLGTIVETLQKKVAACLFAHELIL